MNNQTTTPTRNIDDNDIKKLTHNNKIDAALSLQKNIFKLQDANVVLKNCIKKIETYDLIKIKKLSTL